MSKDFRKASDLINVLFDGFNVNGMEKANAFFRSWKELVGEKIGAHSRIVDVSRGAVIVQVDHPGWSQQIQFRKSAILASLSRSYPELGIKTLVLRVAAECDPPYKRPDAPVGEGVPRRDEEVQADIPINQQLNDELKDVLSRLKESIRKGKS